MASSLRTVLTDILFGAYAICDDTTTPEKVHKIKRLNGSHPASRGTHTRSLRCGTDEVGEGETEREGGRENKNEII